MADSEEQVTSTTSFGEERIHGADLNGADDVNEAAAIEHFNVDDIVDLVGGAQDAIERHIAEESALNEDPELFSSQPEPEPEPVTVSEPVDVSMPVISEPEPAAETEESTPVSDGVVLSSEELVVEPEITSPPTPEPSLPTPEPSPPTPEPSPPTPEPSLPSPAAPPAAAAAPPTREEEPSVAPASYEPSLPISLPTSLMHFPTALGQKGESPAPISPLSPLHSPDSLEELSLTESPNQPPSSWAAAPLGSSSAAPQGAPWGGLDDAKNPVDLLDPLAGPYLSLGKDPELQPNLCEDSGVSFSPEEKPFGSSGPSPTQPQRMVPDSPSPTQAHRMFPDSPSPTQAQRMFPDSPSPTQAQRMFPDSPSPTQAQRMVPDSPSPTQAQRMFPDSPSPTQAQRMFQDSPSPTQAQKMVPDSPSPTQPQRMVPESPSSWETQLPASEDKYRVTMDTAPIGSSRYQVDLHSNESDEEDDLMCEKKNNPFDGFSPLADAPYSHFEEDLSGCRATKVSESPTPDLVQYRQAGDPLGSLPAAFDEGKPYESSKTAAEASVQLMSQYSSALKEYDDDDEEEDSPLPQSLPDLLKSSPLNPDKPDSGSSEGSPEQSPVLERRMMESPNPPINLSAINPFTLDSKVCLLKEMAEATEAKLAGKPKAGEDQFSGAFDLVKEVQEVSPARAREEEPVQIEQKDWFSSIDSPKMPEKIQPLNFESKKTLAEDSDSESPTADSLSPVLEAMAKNPASFQVESEKEVELADEVSEHEVSSEEFEFIERPARGVMDEFLEAFDNSKFASSKVPEIPLDDELSFEKKEITCAKLPTPIEEKEVPSEGSYLLLTQETSLAQKNKAEPEKVALDKPPSPATSPQALPSKPTEGVAEKMTGAIRLFQMPSLKMETVSELLYWRDVKTTGVVFGAALLLLLSLTACSIVSVASYVGLALLSVTVAFRIYKGILQAIQKSDEGHPFKLYLNQEVALSEDVAHRYSDMLLSRINRAVVELRRLFLVDDLVDSIKFAVLMWILTYVGAFFNGLTLLILGLVAVFSCPIIYEKHQAQIDHYVAMVSGRITDIVGKVQAMVPGTKRKAE
ncbi:reticulon-4-like isoform X1 [Gadus macrocephalus]|uniref:reticulon-4-like isoform X1 n=1 Tax=Gadus macrocephalus TaxID=80720 RepID=UPI0028CBB396|nr:reticulon-4-like isoform X1 [Gadus macrocephalus]